MCRQYPVVIISNKIVQSQRNDVMLGHYEDILIHLLIEPNGPYNKRRNWNYKFP